MLVDFSGCTQTIEEVEVHRGDDFGRCLEALLEPEVGLDPELVWEHFATTREVWDLFRTMVEINGKERKIPPPDPFDFVYKR